MSLSLDVPMWSTTPAQRDGVPLSPESNLRDSLSVAEICLKPVPERRVSLSEAQGATVHPLLLFIRVVAVTTVALLLVDRLWRSPIVPVVIAEDDVKE